VHADAKRAAETAVRAVESEVHALESEVQALESEDRAAKARFAIPLSRLQPLLKRRSVASAL
jgi:outer membrane murein-binding lipoprotein Lpp